MKPATKHAMEKRLPFNLRAIAAAAALSVGLATSAGAANINTFIVNGANQISDEDREYLIDRDGTGGVISVGDALRGHINFNTINSGSANLGGATPNDEFSGVFQVRVNAVIPIPSTTQVFVVFGPDPAFIASLAAMGIATTGGEMAALFTDPTKNFCADFDDAAACGLLGGGVDDGTPGRSVPPSSADTGSGPWLTEEAFIATATNGLFWATVGFTGALAPDGTRLAAPGEGIDGQGQANILAAFGLTSGSGVANVNAGFGLINTGAGFDPAVTINTVTPAAGLFFGGLVDFAFSQQIRGVNDLDTPFDISTNTNVSFNATVVPEPGSLALLGIALLGFVGVRRRFWRA